MKSEVIFQLESTNFKNISTVEKCFSFFFFTHFFFLKYCLENFFQNLSNKKRKNNELVTDTKRKTARGGYPLPGNKTRVKVVIYKRKSDK